MEFYKAAITGDTVITEVKHFVGNTEQSDDLTLLAISYKPES